MATIRDRLADRLAGAGWAIIDRHPWRVPGEWIIAEEWDLESRISPMGRRILLVMRYPVDEWFEENILSLRVRLPANSPDGPGPEVLLDQNQVQRSSFRQVVRVLEWFRDPSAWAAWEDDARHGDWVPPPGWEADRWAPLGGMEHRWASCQDPLDMIRRLPGRPDSRRLRLFACGCCRHRPGIMEQACNILAVEAAERYAEWQSPKREMKKACKHSDLAWLAQHDDADLAMQAVRELCKEQPRLGPALATDMLRDVFGNPFQSVVLRHSWLRSGGGAALYLAQDIAAGQRFDEMPVLGDALEDSGCNVPVILEHCRAGGLHARGCWVLDLLTGKG